MAITGAATGNRQLTMSTNRSHNDPALRALYQALESMEADFRNGISEYTLISKLQKPPFELLDEQALRDNLLLFQCHFVLFNLLYTLQVQWAQEGKGWLDILATNIVLLPTQELSNRLTLPDPLRVYYLDWNNLDATQREDVDELIEGFWVKMGRAATPVVTSGEMAQARALLEISEEAVLDKTLVKKHYRRLQHLHHPDKGGDNTLSRQLIWAYEVLISHC